MVFKLLLTRLKKEAEKNVCKFERSDLRRAEVAWWGPRLKEFCPVLEHWKLSQDVAQYCALQYPMLSQR